MLIITQFSLHNEYIEKRLIARNRKSELGFIINGNTIISIGKPFIISKSRRPLAGNNATKLHALNLMDIRVVNEEGGTIRSDISVAAHLIPSKFSSPNNRQQFAFRSRILPPPGWLPEMTDLVQNRLHTGKNSTSVHILLATQWPDTINHVDIGWLGYLIKKGNTMRSIQNVTRMESNESNATASEMDSDMQVQSATSTED